ncbi:hypothetical protein DMUE_3560, partial [Dictyocoela muelleri]
MKKNGVIHYGQKTSPYNIQHFRAFNSNLLMVLTEKEIENPIFVMDNVPFHKSNEIKNILDDSTVRLLFLPPYSFFLNPIENLFTQWKDKVKSSNCSDEDSLFLEIRKSF